MKIISVQINGKSEKISAGISVKDYLVSKGINPHVVACELNLKILKRASLSETILNEGDTLEVIQMIGGG
ncbi:MAG: hypothetical protein KCHDKBKB_00569 [Elusimicrobia bacterium]|nr:hypothetical protein [Elusimicrobiota bacterium]